MSPLAQAIIYPAGSEPVKHWRDRLAAAAVAHAAAQRHREENPPALTQDRIIAIVIGTVLMTAIVVALVVRIPFYKGGCCGGRCGPDPNDNDNDSDSDSDSESNGRDRGRGHRRFHPAVPIDFWDYPDGIRPSRGDENDGEEDEESSRRPGSRHGGAGRRSRGSGRRSRGPARPLPTVPRVRDRDRDSDGWKSPPPPYKPPPPPPPYESVGPAVVAGPCLVVDVRQDRAGVVEGGGPP